MAYSGLGAHDDGEATIGAIAYLVRDKVLFGKARRRSRSIDDTLGMLHMGHVRTKKKLVGFPSLSRPIEMPSRHEQASWI